MEASDGTADAVVAKGLSEADAVEETCATAASDLEQKVADMSLGEESGKVDESGEVKVQTQKIAVRVGHFVQGPDAIQAQTICEDPHMVLYENFVSEEEVQHILKLADGRWEQSKTSKGTESQLLASKLEGENAGSYGEQTTSSTRTSMSVRLTWAESVVIDRISARVASVTGYDVSFVEPLVLLKYEKGEFFKVHHDGAMRPATVFIYLNDIPEGGGGETLFHNLGFQIKPKAHTALMWYNRAEDGSADERMQHEAKPLLAGTKYGINCFVSIHKQRDASNMQIVQLGPAEEEEEPHVA
eukprot:TRINITY_DN51069_c0_g1_i1.p1 TRINITY_DN51069_c0_g1~~TRINITY_DN51069_c0_g1_i1.p1  ORF type:complete len:322 (+),score=53.45 TRINITY_DN51069_c0_g1_i1:67-966(+)